MGQSVCSDLLALGYNVRGLTRRAQDVKTAVGGSNLGRVEWVNGNLNELSGLADVMKGVDSVIFAPLLASRAGLDPSYAKVTMNEDIQMNRRIYSDAVAELLRLGKREGLRKFVLVSAAGAGLAAQEQVDEIQQSAPTRPRRPLRVEPSLRNKEVLRWKLSGESLLRTSGVPFTIVRAYSPPPRPWNDPQPSDFHVAILPGGGPGLSGTITREDLGHVAAQALVAPQTEGITFQAVNVPKGMEPDALAAISKLDPRFPDWRQSLADLVTDFSPVTAGASVK